jgi:uncharacterized protein (DUF2141 family)
LCHLRFYPALSASPQKSADGGIIVRSNFAPAAVFLFVLLVTVLIGGGGAPAAADTLQVAVEGVRSSRGQVLVAVHRRADSFPSNWQGATKVGRFPAGRKPAEIKFDDIAKGRYAVVVLHDEDDSGGMTSNGIGFPLEGYGTSNNPSQLGVPTFEPSVINVAGQTRITIRLKYP